MRIRRAASISEWSGWATLRFLRLAGSLIPVARDDGANMRNCAFTLRQPGREIVIISGNGNWEYDFYEDVEGEIYARCIHKPFLRYFWDAAKSSVVRLRPCLALTATGGVFLELRALTYWERGEKCNGVTVRLSVDDFNIIWLNFLSSKQQTLVI